MKQIQIVLEFVPYVPKPEYYSDDPENITIEEMAEIDVEGFKEDPYIWIQDYKFKVKYNIIDV